MPDPTDAQNQTPTTIKDDRDMRGERQQVGRRFWLWWILASVAGGVLGIIGLGEGVQTYAVEGQASLPFWILGLALGAVSGVALAAIAFVILRREASRTWWCLGIFVIAIIGWTSVGKVSQLVTIGGMAIPNAIIAASMGIWLGGCVGALQWLVLRRRVAGAGWWVLVSVAAWSILITAGFPTMSTGLVGHITTGMVVTGPGELSISGRDINSLSHAGFAIFIGIVFGAQLGLMQWLVLRRNINLARWWPLASAAGWALAWLVAGFIFKYLPTEVRFEYYGGLLMGGLLVGLSGAATGFPLAWLLRQGRGSPKVPHLLRPTAAWVAGAGVVVAVAASALGVALATINIEPKISLPAEKCYSVQSDMDDLVVLNIDPPEGTTLQPGAEVVLTARVEYKLESHDRAILYFRWTDNLNSGVIAQSQVSGSGQVILKGTLVVPNSEMVYLTVHLSPPPDVVNRAGFTCWFDILYETAVGYPIRNVQE